jgi:hypothetical protein
MVKGKIFYLEYFADDFQNFNPGIPPHQLINLLTIQPVKHTFILLPLEQLLDAYGEGN